MTHSDRSAPDDRPIATRFPVVIIDDHELFSMSLRLALAHSGVDASGLPIDGVEQLLAQPPHEPLGLIVLDLDLGVDPDGRRRCGADLVEGLRAKGWAVLIVTAGGDEPSLAAALAYGAIGVVEKSSGFDVLLGAVLAAARGESLMSTCERHRWQELHRHHQARKRALAQRLGQLTPREREILDLLAQGQPAAAIADDLVVSVTTVRTHIRSILAKTGVNSQLGAVALVRPGIGTLSP